MTTSIMPRSGVMPASPPHGSAIAAARARNLRLQRAVALLTVLLPALGVCGALALVRVWGWPPASVWIATAVLYVVTVLGVTVGYHRHFTHAGFSAPAPVRALLGIAGSMAGQGPLLFWVAEHRLHHQHGDRPGDPHSPVLNGFWHAHVGWMLGETAPDLGRYAVDLLRDRLAVALSQGYFVWLALGCIAPGVAAGLVEHTASAALLGVLWGGLVRIFLVHHATWAVNSVCHRFGARPYSTRDASTNHWLVALLTLGEGWHNNHHASPTSARHGLRAWELDPSWWTIRTLAAIGLARDVKTPKPRQERESRAS